MSSESDEDSELLEMFGIRIALGQVIKLIQSKRLK